MPVEAEMGQHIISINKLGLEDILFLWGDNKTGTNRQTRNHVWYIPPKKLFTPALKRTPQPQLL